jgi:DNA-binding transcriptional ArsR family regulator
MPAPTPTTSRRREATTAEARALAHPVRLRILRLCLDEPRTNKQLADALGRDPATVLHHVRTLVATGFLAAAEVRTGASGALEKPYVATLKSWGVDTEHTEEGDAVNVAMVQAFRDEILEAGKDSVLQLTRLGLRLDQAGLDELRTRLEEVVEDFAARPRPADGEPVALFVALHRRP